MNPNLPKSFPSAAAKVRLLQDAVYAEDAELWATLIRYRSQIENYFCEIGLGLVVHEEDGFAYLQQEPQQETVAIPRLFRRDKLTRGVAVIGVVLREQLLQFDEKIHDESRLIMRKEEIMQLVSPFFPETNDQIRADRRIEASLTKAEELGLIRRLSSGEGGDERYEVRRIVKARFSAETLKDLRGQLELHANSRENQ